MEIRVKCGCGEEECSEWMIVELQGVVETQSSFQGSVQNLEIGRLCHSDSSQVFFLSFNSVRIFSNRNCEIAGD